MNRELELLGLNENSTLDEVKSAFKTFAKKYHPDLNPTIPAEIFIAGKSAYEYLLKNHVPKKKRIDGSDLSQDYKMNHRNRSTKNRSSHPIWDKFFDLVR